MSMRLLTLEEAEQSSILKEYGLNCAPTDFSLLLGCNVSSYHYTSDGDGLKDRSCFWFTQTLNSLSSIYGFICNNKKDIYNLNIRSGGIRFCLPFSSLKDQNITYDNISILKEIEYGSYPSFMAPSTMQNTLEVLYMNKKLKRTGKKYTTDASGIYDYNKPFEIREFLEYEYCQKKYIRFTADKNSDGKILSDGTIVRNNKSYWISVEKVKWLYDENLDLLISKNVLFSGAQISNQKTLSSFYDSDIKWVIDNFIYFDIADNKNVETNYYFDFLDKSDHVRLANILTSPEFLNYGKTDDCNDFLLKILLAKYFDISFENVADVKKKLECYKDKINSFMDSMLDIVNEKEKNNLIRKR